MKWLGMAAAAATVAVCLAGAVLPAAAQQTPGKSDGAVARNAAPTDCETLRSEVLPVSVCLSDQVWALGNTEGEKEMSFRRKDNEHYMLVITEKDFFPQEKLREAILINAQNAAGLKKAQVIEDAKAQLDGNEFDRIVYRATIDGLDITYDNYYRGLEGQGSVQFVFFSLTDEYQAFKPVIEQTVQGVQVD